jgi:hypothetical protein
MTYPLRPKSWVVQIMFFSITMCGYEGWTIRINKRKIDAVEMWCWRRLLRIPWSAGGTNSHVLDIIEPDISLESISSSKN